MRAGGAPPSLLRVLVAAAVSLWLAPWMRRWMRRRGCSRDGFAAFTFAATVGRPCPVVRRASWGGAPGATVPRVLVAPGVALARAVDAAVDATPRLLARPFRRIHLRSHRRPA